MSKGRLAERSEATRGLLVAAARDLFAEKGYAGTTTEDVVQRAAVTRGALYHHFDGKDELFRVVYEEIERELAERSATAAAGGRTALSQLRRGMEAFLDACLEPDVQRIVLLDGLSVLGWEQWHAIGATWNFGLMCLGLQAAMEAGEIARRPVEPLAHLMQGGLIQMGMMLARADDPAAARKATGAELRRMLDGLRV